MNTHLTELYRTCKSKESLASQDEYKSANVLIGSDIEKFAELIVSDVLSEVGKFIRRNPGYWDEYGLVTDIALIYTGAKE